MATLNVEQRKEVGKYAAFALRKQGRIPGVIYGKGEENVNVQVELRELEHLLHQGERLVDLVLDGKKKRAIIQEVQHGVFAHELLHVDLRLVSQTERIHVNVAIEIEGEAAGAALGGVVEQSLFEVEVECLPKDLPEKVVLDISPMQVGDILHVSELPSLEGIGYRTAGDVPVVSCHMPAGEEEPEPEAAAAESGEPEVIGEKEREEKKDED